jgi:putative ATP-dependent endonuclease of the OLD family
MYLKQMILKNFRIYEAETRIDISGLTTLIGRNDAGKSSILEALEIFFNQEVVSIEHQDASIGSGSKLITLGCVFGGIADEKLVLDETARTTLRAEHLLNAAENLEVRKVFDCEGAKIKESVFIIAIHPTNKGMSDLLFLKNSDLKKRAKELSVGEETMDQRINPSIRSAIWHSAATLDLAQTEIPLEKEDARKLWQALERALPMFALFRSDRPSRDEDPEAQDPMKIAVQEALKEVSAALEEIKEAVKLKVSELAKLTLEKLRDFAPELANELSPEFRADPKWDQLFKMTLKSENEIPVNKRGSGVRRLILLSFFRAAAERKQELRNAPCVIYAVEEPETSQHPIQQQLLIDAFEELVDNGSQVLITTHNPALGALVPSEGIRYVHSVEGRVRVDSSEDALQTVSKELGVLADHRIKVLVCVEGRHDVSFLRHISRILRTVDPAIPDLLNDERVAFCPLGGSSLNDWVQKRYFRGLNRPEIHLYDRGNDMPPQYEAAAQTVNARGDHSYACLTGKRELENYLHREAIRESSHHIDVIVGDDNSIPELVAEAVHNGALGAGTVWVHLEEAKKKKKISSVKRWLNDEAASRMTVERLVERDPHGDLENWLRRVGELCG